MKPTDDLRVKGYQQLMEPGMLKQELAINKAMAENSPINIILANTDLEITYVNPASSNTLKTFWACVRRG